MRQPVPARICDDGHFGYLVDSARITWADFRRGVRGNVVFERAGDPSHLYLDTRAALGHYVEYIWLSAGRMSALKERVPQN